MSIPSICLNMIVKNESHIIKKTLDNILKYIPLSYWVISDTGSTDDTKEIIQEYFKNKNIPGELFEDEWVDFGYNRTLALEYAFKKSDFLFIFDADDSINNEFVLPNELIFDRYLFIFGPEFTYYRPLLLNNTKKWCFKGVLHEFLMNLEPVTDFMIEGNYFVQSGREGNRNKNPMKYINDANILKNAFFKEEFKDIRLAGRYAFYCAQSFKDAGPSYIDDSIDWYKKCLTLDMWKQEQYYSCLKIGELYTQKNDPQNALHYWYKSIEYDPERIEGIISAVEYLRNQNEHLLVNALYYKFKNYQLPSNGKLFLSVGSYNDYLEYYNSISAFYIHDYYSGYECCKIIFLNQKLPHHLLVTSIGNFQFYIDFINNDNNDNVLQLFYTYDEIIHKFSLKNEKITEKMVNVWNKLYNRCRSLLTNPSNFVFNRKIDNPTIIITFTTCKRLNLFKETIYSILNHWLDLDKIDFWFCVDDNSSSEDRCEMTKLFPWIEFYMKPTEEKGHLQSMNIIWNKLNEFKPTYWIHMEDDWLFYNKQNYIENAINGLNYLKKYHNGNIKQLLFNRNYGQTVDCYNSIGYEKTDDPNLIIQNYNPNIYFSLQNHSCWPHYSFRPSLTEVEPILKIGDYSTEHTFFEGVYAHKWTNSGYKSAFFNRNTSRHIGRLSWEISDKTKKNAYQLNDVLQF
jgi:hypothetical protein